MKLTVGGGGVDAEGNSFTVRQCEIEVDDGWIDRVAAAFAVKDDVESLSLLAEAFSEGKPDAL